MFRLIAVVAILLIAACSHSSGTASSPARVASTPAGPRLAPASGQLDAEVVTPPNFPVDVPIYPGARLTAGASFTSTGQVAWGMEWETVDAPAKVESFYSTKFAQGDWTFVLNSGTNGIYTATVTRKSNAHFRGTLALNSDPGVTKILLSLVDPAA